MKIGKGKGARNFSQCDSLLLGDRCGAHTFPYIESENPTAMVGAPKPPRARSARTDLYLNQRGIETEKAVSPIVNGYCKEVLNQLPMEFAVEAQSYWL